MPPAYLGEFEHLLLLAVLRLGSEAYGADIARELDIRAGRSVSRGALYTSLDRLEDKGLLRWNLASGTALRPAAARVLGDAGRHRRVARIARGPAAYVARRRGPAEGTAVTGDRQPPRLARWLLDRALGPGPRGDTIRGDLLEEFRAAEKSRRAAWRYRRHA